MTPDLRLVVNGVAYGGWKSIRVRRSLEEVAGYFDLGVSELWPTQATPREIRPGDRAGVTINGVTVITGFVDEAEVNIDARSHEVRVQGRDATGDLVDCSAVHAMGEWRNARLDQIARDLAAPYGVPVKVQTDIGAAFAAWAVQDGESIFECLERAARQRGVLLLTDGLGGLVLGQASATRIGTDLVEGVNLLSCTARNDASERFQHYILKGQRPGNDDDEGEATSTMKATATDGGVARPRTLVLVTEDEGDTAALARRARWEANVRAARALTANVSVQGWSHPGGLWRPNTLVRLRAPTARLARDLLVRDVELIADDQGTRTEMVLTPREAYTLHTPSAPKSGRKKKDEEDFLE